MRRTYAHAITIVGTVLKSLDIKIGRVAREKVFLLAARKISAWNALLDTVFIILFLGRNHTKKNSRTAYSNP